MKFIKRINSRRKLQRGESVRRKDETEYPIKISLDDTLFGSLCLPNEALVAQALYYARDPLFEIGSMRMSREHGGIVSEILQALFA